VRQGGVKHDVDRTGDGVDGCLDSVCIGGFDGIKGPKPSSCGGPGFSEKEDVVCEYCFASIITELTNGEE
jgi:hypothetical protein